MCIKRPYLPVIMLNSGNVVFLVDDMELPISGTCPCCGARVYARHSRKGVVHGVLYPGEVHAPDCIYGTGKAMFSLASTQFRQLIQNSTHEKPKRTPGFPGGHGGEAPHIPATHPPKKDENEPTIRQARNLNNLIRAGLLYAPADYSLGDGRQLIDYFVRPEWLELVTENKLTGARIFGCRFGGIDEAHFGLYLNLVLKKENVVLAHLHLVLRMKKELFESFACENCTYVTDVNGRTKLKLIYEKPRILVAGHWSKVPCYPQHCYAAKCYGCGTCTGMYSAPALSRKQLLFIEEVM